jgi:hypothetical protein
VVHPPGHTPYIRKLCSCEITIIDEMPLPSGEGIVPCDVSFSWLARRSHFDFFDVLHMHSVELASVDDLREGAGPMYWIRQARRSDHPRRADAYACLYGASADGS